MSEYQSLCAFLSRLFERELDAETLRRVRGVRFPEEGPWGEAGARWNRCAGALAEPQLEALAVDYARVFLGAGLAEAAAAFPFESVYTSPRGVVMQDAWSRMRERLSERGLRLNTEDAGLTEDHVSVELAFCGALEDPRERSEFARLHLLNWVPRFAADVERYAETEFYRAAAGLLTRFAELSAEPPRSEEPTGTAGAAAEEPAARVERSFVLSSEDADALLEKLGEDYDVYGPARDGKGAVRFLPVRRFSELALDSQSDFSPKEIYYPISQPLFRFDENAYSAELPPDGKPALILAHPCDVNAIRRLDNIFLKNGGHADLWYRTLRERVRFAMLECPEAGYPGCWCVSMGTNRTDDWAMALRVGEGFVQFRVADGALLPFFAEAPEAVYEPRFVTENARKAQLPRVGQVDRLQKVFDLEFWKQYNGKCISCGGCNTVCPTCSCYETADYLDQENSRKGERRRVWASCMIPDFTRTAGGHVARPTPDKLMRFKALHKVFDYNTRFGGQEHMCVGCGRCVLRCPEDIDFLDTINRLHDEVERLISEQEERA